MLQFHDTVAARGPGALRDLDGRQAHDHSLGRDGRHLVPGAHHPGRRQALPALGRGDPLAAAPLEGVLAQGGALAVAVAGHRAEKGLGRPHQVHGHHGVFGRQGDGPHPGRVAAHGPQLFLGEADGLPLGRDHDDILAPRRRAGPDQCVPLLQDDGQDAVRARLPELGQRGALDLAAARDQDDTARLPVVDRGHADDPLMGVDRDQVGEGQALGIALGIGELVGLDHVGLAAVAEEEQVVFGVGDGGLGHGVLLAGADLGAAAGLAAVGVERQALDVAALAHRHQDLDIRDQVGGADLPGLLTGDAGAAGVAVLALQRLQVALDDLQHPLRVGQDILQLGDLGFDLAVLLLDLFALQGGQAAQLQVQDRLRLEFA